MDDREITRLTWLEVRPIRGPSRERSISLCFSPDECAIQLFRVCAIRCACSIKGIVQMSANEFVVIQVWTRYEGSTDGRWLDYSRCTAAEALRYMTSKQRAKHWISGDELTVSQLERMTVAPELWESKPPTVGADVSLSRRQADILSESLLNALLETDRDQWTSYTDALDAFCAVATPGHLEMWRDAQEGN